MSEKEAVTPRQLSKLQRDMMFHHRLKHQEIVDRLNLYYGQHMVLMALFHCGKSTQRELAQHLNISPAAVAMTLKKLVKADLIKRQSSPDDQRCNLVSLTQKGEDLALICIEGFHRVDDRLFTGFSEDELSTLKSFYERMIENIKNTEGESI